MFKTKRIYEPPSKSDGFRVLVDRLWPRGISKDNAHIDLWLKEIAPSHELRKWYNHEIEKWDEFRDQYVLELKSKQELLDQLKDLEKTHTTVTLLYGAHDMEHNQAVVLLTLT